MKKIFTAICIVLILSSCSTYKQQQNISNQNSVTLRQILDTYIGKQASDVVAKMGPPTEVESDYKDGKILIYKTTQTKYYNTGPDYVANEKHPLAFKLDYSNSLKSSSSEAALMFWINKENVIYKWSTKGINVDE